MNRTPLAGPVVHARSRSRGDNPDVARQLRAIAAQYELARASILLLATETTRLAAAGSLRSMTGAVSSRAQSEELIAIVTEINATLSAAIEPMQHATDSLKQLSAGALPEPTTDAEDRNQALLVQECANAVHSLGAAIARMDEG